MTGILDFIQSKQPGSQFCANPKQKMRCNWCGWTGKCGTAPHDEQGALCAGCGRGEDLEETA